MPTARWTQDLFLESQFSEFLDTCLYRPLENNITYPDGSHPLFERISDKNMQYMGIDILLRERGAVTAIDEKSQLHHINKDICTQAFELSYLKNGIVEAGWFLNPRKKTDAYLICWPHGEKSEVQDIYTGAKVLLVFKHHLMDALKRYGFTREELAERDACIRQGERSGRYRTRCNDFWLYYTGGEKYVEAPINLVIRSTLLEKLSVINLNISIDEGSSTSNISGIWAGRPINISESLALLQK